MDEYEAIEQQLVEKEKLASALKDRLLCLEKEVASLTARRNELRGTGGSVLLLASSGALGYPQEHIERGTLLQTVLYTYFGPAGPGF